MMISFFNTSVYALVVVLIFLIKNIYISYCVLEALELTDMNAKSSVSSEFRLNRGSLSHACRRAVHAFLLFLK